MEAHAALLLALPLHAASGGSAEPFEMRTAAEIDVPDVQVQSVCIFPRRAWRARQSSDSMAPPDPGGLQQERQKGALVRTGAMNEVILMPLDLPAPN